MIKKLIQRKAPEISKAQNIKETKILKKLTFKKSFKFKKLPKSQKAFPNNFARNQKALHLKNEVSKLFNYQKAP